MFHNFLPVLKTGLPKIMLGIKGNESQNKKSLLRFQARSGKNRDIRPEIIGMEIKQLLVGVNFYLFFPKVFRKTLRGNDDICKRDIEPVLPLGMVGVFKIDTWFA